MEYYRIREARAELFSIIKGIELRIFQSEIALNLFEEIENNFESISANGFGNLFFNLKLIALNDMINCVCGIFDIYDEHSKYPVQSIPHAIHFIELKREELEIKDRKLLIEKLTAFEIKQKEIEHLTDSDLTQTIVEQIRERSPKPNYHKKKDDIRKFFKKELNSALYNLRNLRDKKVAHFENTTINHADELTIKEALLLIEFAKNFIDLIGNGYLGYDYSRNETHPRKQQAENFSKDLNKLLKKANII
jgi:hypothetical protein